MPNPNDKFRDLDPTVIPAQPGYRVAVFGSGDQKQITDQTKPEDLRVAYDTVIAWIIHPTMREVHGDVEVGGAGVYIVTPDGMDKSNESYLVAPDGSWSQTYGLAFSSEVEARKHFIASKLRSSGQG